MVNSEDFAKRLQLILDYYGLSATAFSDRIDFNRSTISHLLSGRNKPSLEFVMKVLEEFPDVELYWLLNGKGSFPSEETALEKISSPTPTENGKPTETTDPARENPTESVRELKRHVTDKDIEQIVIFFKDGSFKAYR